MITPVSTRGIEQPPFQPKRQVNPQSSTAFLSVFARELVKFPQPKWAAAEIYQGK